MAFSDQIGIRNFWRFDFCLIKGLCTHMDEQLFREVLKYERK